MKRTFLTLALLVSSFVSALAYDFTAICETGQELAYTINEDKETVCVVKNSNSIFGELLIPASVEYDLKTYMVTSIWMSAFEGCTELTSITIPESVTSIGKYTFKGCTGLTSITIPESVTTIAESAFYGCTSLTSIAITESVTSIGNFAFSGCSGLTSITIPESVTSIGHYAFSICTGLTSITIPQSVTWIGGGAFYGCTSLTSITIPESVTSIKDEAFRGCTGLTSITIPESVTSIVKDAFWDCTDLTSINVKEGNTTYDSRDNCNAIIHTKSNTLSKGCNATIIPESVTSIGDHAFWRCTGLTSINIPESVTSIGDHAFGGCTSLTSITISESVTSIGDNAFYGCTSLTSITIPEGVTSIGYNAFGECTDLTSIICMATNPPTSEECPYSNYDADLYVPSEAIETYKADEFWSQFKNIKPIPTTEEVELQKDEVIVQYEETEAVFSMPMNEDTKSYTLTISQNGVVFCTLTFNKNGQLANIDFSTKAGAMQGFQFTVTGLSAATDYKYSFKALNEDKEILKEYVGSFTTKNEDGTGGSAEGGSAQSEQGGEGGEQGGEQGGEGGSTAISEVSNATAVTIVNGQILVNGEAPAFVVTVSGHKTANANLKAGVYFVVVDGETVGVSVR